ncbi:MAG: amidohydrolase family protein [Pirellulaceae bacterium]
MQHKRLSRRNFSLLAGTAATAAALPSTTQAQNDETNSAGWIDAHVHVWTPDTTQYPLATAAGFSKADMQPPSFTAAELLDHCRPAGVKRIVLIQMSFYQYDHSYMLQVMQDHPGVFSGVALIDWRADNAVVRMKELAEQGMRGFRLHSHNDADQWTTEPSMGKLWRAAGEAGLAMCPLINPTDIPHVAKLAEKFPDTTVVVDHFARVGISGHIDPLQLDALCGLARFPKVHVKTSAFYALGKKQPPYDDLQPMIRRVVDAFGAKRLMWASDCPFQVEGNHSYTASIALIRDRIDFLSADEKRAMLRDTAERLFFQ